MRDFKLNIDLLPKGAWNNDLSKTLPKKDWDKLRGFCYKKAYGKCQICGYETNDLDAHEMWNFDLKTKTQSLKNIIALCSKCHGVIHLRNSQRLGYGENAKRHFMKVNNASELDFASHLAEAQLVYEERNLIYYWKMVADLEEFGVHGIELKNVCRKKIKSPYTEYDLNDLKNSCNLLPRVLEIDVNNYDGTIVVKCDKTNKIEWYDENGKVITKYNFSRNLVNIFSVKGMTGKNLYFRLHNEHGSLTSKIFLLEDWE